MPSTPSSPSTLKRSTSTPVFARGAIILATLGPLVLAAAQTKGQPSTARPELVLQLGHSGAITGLALSLDGQTLVSAGADRTLRIWNTQSGELQQVVTRGVATPQSVAFSPDGQWFAVATGERFTSGELLLWNARTRQLSRVLQARVRGYSADSRNLVAFSPDSQTLATTQGAQVDFWNVSIGKKTRTIAAHTNAINALAFSPDGKRLATASGDGTIKVWDSTNGQLRRTFKGEGKTQFAVAFSPDGKSIAGGSVKSSEMEAATFITVWDLATGKTRTRVGQVGVVSALCFSPDGKTLMSGGAMWGVGVIAFTDIATGKSQREIAGRSDSFFPMILSADGETLVTAGLTPVKPENFKKLDYFSGDLQIWDVKTGQLRRSLRGHQRPVEQVAFTNDGKSIIEVGQDRRTLGTYLFDGQSPDPVPATKRRDVNVWNTKTGALSTTRSGKEPFALSPSNKIWAFADEVDHTQKRQFQDEKKKIHVETIHVPEPVIALQDAATGRRIATLRSVVAQNLTFSPDSRTLAIVSYGGESEKTYRSQGILTLWDTATGKMKRKLATSTSVGGNAVRFSPNGSLLATGGSTGTYEDTGAVQLWNAATGKPVRTLKVSNSVSSEITSLAFTPNGKTLIGRSTFGLVWWNVQTGKQERAIATTALISEGDPGEGGGKTPVAISPDGKTIATETGGLSIRLWDLQTGKMKRELRGHTGGIFSLAFSPDSKSLVSGSWDSTAKVWNATSGELRATLVRLPDTRNAKGMNANWVAFTPAGNYQSSPGAASYIRWRVGDKVYPAETYKTQQQANLLP